MTDRQANCTAKSNQIKFAPFLSWKPHYVIQALQYITICKTALSLLDLKTPTPNADLLTLWGVVSGERRNTGGLISMSTESRWIVDLVTPMVLMVMLILESRADSCKERNTEIKVHWNLYESCCSWNNPFIYSTNTNTQDSLCLYRYSSKSFMDTNEATFGLSITTKWKKCLTVHGQHKTAFLGCLVRMLRGFKMSQFKGYLCVSWHCPCWSGSDYIPCPSSTASFLRMSMSLAWRRFSLRAFKKRQDC